MKYSEEDRSQKGNNAAVVTYVHGNRGPKGLAGAAHHGVVLFDSEPESSTCFKSWGRSFNYYRKDHQEAVFDPNFHCEKYRKRHDKAIRKDEKYIKALFACDDEMICRESGPLKVSISLKANARKLVNSQVRSEVYNPLAIESDGNIVGGMNAYFWHCNHQDSAQVLSLQQQPVTHVVTGMCMFGANLIGVDKEGNHHPLTNTFYQQADSSIIERVNLLGDIHHPYEAMMFDELDQQCKLYKVLGGAEPPQICFQSVIREYLLYGIDRYIHGKMTLSALCAYAQYVEVRANAIKAVVQRVCSENGLMWDGGDSTLAGLFCHDADASTMVIDFLNHFELGYAAVCKDMSNARLTHIIHSGLQRIIENSPPARAAIWRRMYERLQAVPSMITNGKTEQVSLLSLGFMNYAVKVAAVEAENEGARVCLAHPFHEKAMALAYKDLHSEHHGSIVALNWVPPIFTHDAFKQGLYYLEDNQVDLSHAIHEGIVRHCNHQVAAEALENWRYQQDQFERVQAFTQPIYESV